MNAIKNAIWKLQAGNFVSLVVKEEHLFGQDKNNIEVV